MALSVSLEQSPDALMAGFGCAINHSPHTWPCGGRAAGGKRGGERSLENGDEIVNQESQRGERDGSRLPAPAPHEAAIPANKSPFLTWVVSMGHLGRFHGSLGL